MYAMGIKRLRFWLSSLSGQVIMVALLILVIIQLVGIQIYRMEREETLGLVNSRFALQRVVSATRLLNQSPESLHSEILRASRSETLRLRIVPQGLELAERNPHFERIVRSTLEYPKALSIQISAERSPASTQGLPANQTIRGQAKPMRRHPGMRHGLRMAHQGLHTSQ